MTIHSSLRGVDTLRGERSVLSRIERLQKLAKEGKLDPAKNSVWGLPKVRTKFKVVGAKKAKAADAAPDGSGEAAVAVEEEAGTKGESKGGSKSDKKSDKKDKKDKK